MTSGRAAGPLKVYLEVGAKKTFTSAMDWPGWSRSGRDEQTALDALLECGPRYVRVVGRTAGFKAPKDTGELTITERLTGDAATDFGAPGAIPLADRAPLTDDELGRLEKIFSDCWKAFERASKGAQGKKLSKGPRGGGRDLAGIEEHVRGAEQSYAAQVGLRGDLLEAVRARARGELPDVGPRGGERWPARYAIRRAAWHVLDHAWEIEDRSASQG